MREACSLLLRTRRAGKSRTRFTGVTGTKVQTLAQKRQRREQQRAAEHALFFSDCVFEDMPLFETMPLDVTRASAAAALALPFPGMLTYADAC